MSFSHITYVIIPKDYDFEQHISILESTGINVDIKTAKEVLKEATKSGAHCQDFPWLSWSKDDVEDGYTFAVRVLKELDMVLHEYETGQNAAAIIINLREHILANRKNILNLLSE
jgi:hypothetical protein